MQYTESWIPTAQDYRRMKMAVHEIFDIENSRRASGKTADLDVYNCLTGGVSGTDLLPDGDDPLAIFNISRTVNEESGLLYGFEFAGQHLFGDGYGVTANYTSVNGDLGIQYAELNKGRLPYYHRLDLSISKIVKVANKSDLEISASVTNVYNRENIFYFNRIKYERVNQLPIMPSIGASITF